MRKRVRGLASLLVRASKGAAGCLHRKCSYALRCAGPSIPIT